MKENINFKQVQLHLLSLVFTVNLAIVMLLGVL